MTPVPLQTIYSFLAPVESSINGDLDQQEINRSGNGQGDSQIDHKAKSARLLNAAVATGTEPVFIVEVVVNAFGFMAVMAGAWFAVSLLSSLLMI